MCGKRQAASGFLDFAKQVAWWLPVYLAGTDLVGAIIRVDGQSMQPTLNVDTRVFSDWILVEKVSYKWLHRYQRGDVAVLWAPDQPHSQLIKRIIALEQDVLWDDETHDTIKVPKGRCWIEGDNAAVSGDSRTMYGPVHLGLLEGRAACIVWPPWRMGLLHRDYPRDRVIVEAAQPQGYHER